MGEKEGRSSKRGGMGDREEEVKSSMIFIC